MQIPRIVHQLWKTDDIPARWREAVHSVKRYHKGWEYRLWTDERVDEYVRTNHPRFYPVFAGFNRHIMRVDVFRYVLMHDIGGLYCDLDYEFVRPFDYGDAQVVLSLEYDEAYGDDVNQVANYVFASAPKHALWRDVLDNLQRYPPHAAQSVRRLLGDRTVVSDGSFLQASAQLRGREAHAEARAESAPRTRPQGAQVLREQRNHVRLPPRLGLVAGSPELGVREGEADEAARARQVGATKHDFGALRRAARSACRRAPEGLTVV